MQENKKPKILMATTIAKAFGWFVTDSAKNFSEKGFDVTVMCGETDEEFIKKHENFAHVVPLSITRGMNPLTTVKCILELRRLFKSEKFDIIQYGTPNISLCCTLTPGFRKIPVRIYGQWGYRYEGFTGVKRAVFKFIEKITCKGATHISCVSKENRQIAIDEGFCTADKIFVIGEGGTIGVDLATFDIAKKTTYRQDIRQKLGIAQTDFVFGFIGRQNKDKGLDELITAYRALIETQKNTKLIIVGMVDETNPPDKELMEWAHESRDVIFAGSVPRREIPSLMSSMDILVHPTYREGFSMVIKEALAMELPVITCDVPGPSEVVAKGETGVLVPVKDSKALFDEMLALMNDEHRRESYANAGRKRVLEHFTRQKRLDLTYQKYVEILKIHTPKGEYEYKS